MLTKVYLDGAMGVEFGKEWDLSIHSPAHALRLIDANKPGLFPWIKQNLPLYDRYTVVCEFADGRIEELDNDTLFMECKPTVIRFIPLLAGASSGVRFVVGLILVIVGAILSIYGYGAGTPLISIGVGMMIGAAIEMLTPRPSKKEDAVNSDKTSHFFDGPENTTAQGVPVQLIYGKVLTGAHHISVSLTVDQLI